MSRRKKRLMIVLGILFAVIVIALAVSLGRGGSYYNEDGSYRHVTTASSFRYCMNHPALEGFGQYVLPWENGIVTKVVPPLSLRYMCMCLGYDAQTVADGINFLIDMRTQGKLEAFDFYTQEEKTQNPHLETTRLLFVPGDADKPFAMVIAGGGFTSVCMMQEAFPIAKRLHEEGYPVFMLKYRVGELPTDQETTDKRERAFADLDRAMAYVFGHAEGWGLTTENYAVWGFSAGARITLAWAGNETYGYESCGLPKPALQVPIYSVPQNIEASEAIPNTFMAMGTKDEYYGAEGCDECEAFCDALNQIGVMARFERFEGVKHGFGLGTGTVAEGWIERAIDMWKTIQ